MFKKYKILKWVSLLFLSVIVIIIAFGFWFFSLIPTRDASIKLTSREDLPYLSENIVPTRGKILAVVTSTEVMGNSKKSTGYELSELARAYYTFQANGFEVDIASPKGGKPPVVIDDEDMGAYDFAFLNDQNAQYKTSHTIKLEAVIPEDYEAVFFVGGKGTMFDFPNNKAIQTLVKTYYESDKVIGAVCHGPAALVHVTLDNGRPLLENKTISGFTNKEELLLIPDAKSIFPFLLQDKIQEQGANFNEGSMYLETISHDKNLITGQNPWSTWKTSELIIEQLGYTPKYRIKTDEENAVQVLSIFKAKGKEEAKKMIEKKLTKDKKRIHRVLIAKHGIISAMKGEVGQFLNLIELVAFTKECELKSLEI